MMTANLQTRRIILTEAAIKRYRNHPHEKLILSVFAQLVDSLRPYPYDLETIGARIYEIDNHNPSSDDHDAGWKSIPHHPLDFAAGLQPESREEFDGLPTGLFVDFTSSSP